MKIADLRDIAGRRYPARRHTQAVVGQGLAIEASNFCMGHVTLDPQGGQVPWHNHEQEEVYFVLEGKGQSAQIAAKGDEGQQPQAATEQPAAQQPAAGADAAAAT